MNIYKQKIIKNVAYQSDWTLRTLLTKAFLDDTHKFRYTFYDADDTGDYTPNTSIFIRQSYKDNDAQIHYMLQPFYELLGLDGYYSSDSITYAEGRSDDLLVDYETIKYIGNENQPRIRKFDREIAFHSPHLVLRRCKHSHQPDVNVINEITRERDNFDFSICELDCDDLQFENKILKYKDHGVNLEITNDIYESSTNHQSNISLQIFDFIQIFI